jgi:hypothetical protein
VFDLLDGIEAKLDRAEAQLETFGHEWRSWADEEEPWGVEGKINDGKRLYVFKFRVLKPVPPSFAVKYGEVVHNMRSALDHLACHLVESSGGKVTNSTAWPIKRSKSAWLRQVERRQRPWQLWRKQGGGPLKGIPIDSPAWTLVKRAQPYERRDKGRDDPLWELQGMWNRDKHSLLNPLPVYGDPAAALNVFRFPTISPIEARPLVPLNRPLEDGADFALLRFPLDQPLPEVEVNGRFRVEIAMGDDDGQARRPFRETLQIIRDLVGEAKAL